jgi:hypothetical protein
MKGIFGVIILGLHVGNKYLSWNGDIMGFVEFGNCLIGALDEFDLMVPRQISWGQLEFSRSREIRRETVITWWDRM